MDAAAGSWSAAFEAAMARPWLERAAPSNVAATRWALLRQLEQGEPLHPDRVAELAQALDDAEVLSAATGCAVPPLWLRQQDRPAPPRLEPVVPRLRSRQYADTMAELAAWHAFAAAGLPSRLLDGAGFPDIEVTLPQGNVCVEAKRLSTARPQRVAAILNAANRQLGRVEAEHAGVVVVVLGTVVAPSPNGVRSSEQAPSSPDDAPRPDHVAVEVRRALGHDRLRCIGAVALRWLEVQVEPALGERVKSLRLHRRWSVLPHAYPPPLPSNALFDQAARLQVGGPAPAAAVPARTVL